MDTTGFTLFETAIGPCGVSWGERGIRSIALPDAGVERTRARLARSVVGIGEGPVPAQVLDAIDGISALLEGERADLSAVVIDLTAVAPFDRRVTEVARTIDVGETLTYGEVATRIGASSQAREVGQALGRNRFPLVVPCHRVVAADGLGDFSAPGGTETKLCLLAIERRHAPGPMALF